MNPVWNEVGRCQADERFPLGEASFRSEAEAKGETLFPWDVINTEILETRE